MRPNNIIAQKVSLFRWLDIALYTLICIFIWSIFRNEFYQALEKFAFYTSRSNQGLLISIQLITVYFSCYILNKLGGLHYKHNVLKYIRNPPIYFAGLISFLIIIISWHHQNEISFYETFNTSIKISSITLSGVLLYLFQQFFSDKKTHYTKPNLLHQFTGEEHPFSLENWFLKEGPIRHFDEDLFDKKILAKRIAEFVLIEHSPGIGLLGPYGSGKSSIINLVQNYLKSSNLLVCKIDGWGWSSKDIAQIILTNVIDNISREIDCTSIINLPQTYQGALKGNSTSTGTLVTALFNIHKDPVEQLSKLNSLLATTNLNILLILEDMDRHKGLTPITEQMPPLLDRLKGLDRISFILAIGTQQGFSEIVIRVCEYHEAIGVSQDYISILQKFRHHLNEQIDNPYIAQLYNTFRIHSTLYDLESDRDHISLLNSIIKTPRVLKQILRKSGYIWSRLKGEIDPDDLLILTTLRFTAPHTFDCIIEKIDFIKSIQIDPNTNYHKNQIASITKLIDDVSLEEGIPPLTIKALIYILFPSLTPVNFHFSGEVERFQEIGRTTHTNYFNRYLLESLKENELSDIEFIKTCFDFKNDTSNNESKLPSLLYKDIRYLEKFDDMSHVIFKDNDYRIITSALMTAVCTDLKAGNIPNTFVLEQGPLFRIILNKLKQNPISTTEHYVWLINEVKKLSPHSLALANYLFEELRDNGHRIFKESAPIHTVRQEIVTMSQTIFDTPQSLVHALKFDSPATSYHFVFLNSQRSKGALGFKGEDWKWYADLLLDASEENPNIIIPHILHLLVTANPHASYQTYTYTFNSCIGYGMFRHRKHDLLKTIQNEPPSLSTGQPRLIQKSVFLRYALEKAIGEAGKWQDQTLDIDTNYRTV